MKPADLLKGTAMSTLPLDTSDPVHRTCPLCGYDYAGHRCDNPGCEASGNVPPEILARREREATAQADRERVSRVQAGCFGAADDSEIGPEIRPATYYVVRVNGNDLDAHAAQTLEDALALAMPDDDDTVHYGTVRAKDAGAARLMQPEAWCYMGNQMRATVLSFLTLPTFAAPQAPCRINVNAATAAQLQLFARTGPALALRLTSGRPYRHLAAVDAVKGVGPSWLAVNGPHVAFSGPTTCKAKIPSPKAPKVAAQPPKL
jgi:DNA uptake protein ComE-like DNA-binding protein